MLLLLSLLKMQEQIAENAKECRLQAGLTQAELAKRAGVPLPTLCRFEQKAAISMESFLKIQMILGGLTDIVEATKPKEVKFQSIDAVIKANNAPKRKRVRQQA